VCACRLEVTRVVACGCPAVGVVHVLGLDGAPGQLDLADVPVALQHPGPQGAPRPGAAFVPCAHGPPHPRTSYGDGSRSRLRMKAPRSRYLKLLSLVDR